MQRCHLLSNDLLGFGFCFYAVNLSTCHQYLEFCFLSVYLSVCLSVCMCLALYYCVSLVLSVTYCQSFWQYFIRKDFFACAVFNFLYCFTLLVLQYISFQTFHRVQVHDMPVSLLLLLVFTVESLFVCCFGLLFYYFAAVLSGHITGLAIRTSVCPSVCLLRTGS